MLSQAAAEAFPPPIPFVLSVGVTGHRADMLPEGGGEPLRECIRDTLLMIAAAGGDLLQEQRGCFAPEEMLLRFISPVADGADQIAAEVALELGWELQAVLPFDRAAYRASLANHGARERFDGLLERAVRVVELPGDTEAQPRRLCHDRAGDGGTLRRADRDLGRPSSARARRNRRGRPTRADCAGPRSFTVPLSLGCRHADIMERVRPAGADGRRRAGRRTAARPRRCRRLLRGLLMPPADEQERRFLKRVLSERLRRLRTRIEYPLLLTAAGVRRFGARDLTTAHAEAQIRDEWRRYRVGCAEAHNISAPIGLLEEAYSWADRLATHFAQTYRSGHIFNFLLGGVAVCLGLGAFMAPRLKFEEAALELLITVAIILNAIIGKRQEWHRRWLDYRQLAERLRPMRSLKLLGIAAPDPPGTATNPVPKRWIDWYASGIWRAMGCPSGAIDALCAARLGHAIADHEVEPQVGYHERNATQIELLDHRLEQIGMVLFAATVMVSIATLIGLGFGSELREPLRQLVHIGLRRLSRARHRGVRHPLPGRFWRRRGAFDGDGGDAAADRATNCARMSRLSRAADLSEQAARIMLSDLDEWRLVNQQRDLSVG